MSNRIKNDQASKWMVCLKTENKVENKNRATVDSDKRSSCHWL